MVIKARYNEIYDLSTQSGDATVLKFHAPQSILPQLYLRGYFIQFKKYKYVGTKITLVPAATLPADPLQVSYEAGEPTIDPRDMVNPILHKSYHGEALADDTNYDGVTQYGSFKKTTDNSAVSTLYESKYYATLQDPSWQKSHIQRGFRAWGQPLVRPVASNFQIAEDGTFNTAYLGEQNTHDWSADPDNVDVVDGGLGDAYPHVGNSDFVDGADTRRAVMSSPADLVDADTVDNRVAKGSEFSMFTTGFRKMGWLDTTTRMFTNIENDGSLGVADAVVSTFNLWNKLRGAEYISRLPKIYTYMVMLPPAYKTEFYFRLVLTHYFQFKDFRAASMPLDGARELNVDWGPVYVTPDVAKTLAVPTIDDALEGASVEVSGDSTVKLTSSGVGS